LLIEVYLQYDVVVPPFYLAI